MYFPVYLCTAHSFVVSCPCIFIILTFLHPEIVSCPCIFIIIFLHPDICFHTTFWEFHTFSLSHRLYIGLCNGLNTGLHILLLRAQGCCTLCSISALPAPAVQVRHSWSSGSLSLCSKGCSAQSPPAHPLLPAHLMLSLPPKPSTSLFERPQIKRPRVMGHTTTKDIEKWQVQREEYE